MAKTGIDVSTHNGRIKWEQAKKNIDFAIIRGGYSRTTDGRFDYNLNGCLDNNIPAGVYWFSYALNEEYARKEAQACLKAIDNRRLSLPIFFDYEYDSFNYSYKNGITPTGESIRAITKAFCDYIKEHSNYRVGIYTNVDYINKAYKPMLNDYPIWLAQWSSKKSYSCDIWQKSSTGNIAGIDGYVDIDILYADYIKEDETYKDITLDKPAIKKVCDKFNAKYLETAKEILNGKYGNGNVRKNEIKNIGMDYDFAQSIVNAILEE